MQEVGAIFRRVAVDISRKERLAFIQTLRALRLELRLSQAELATRLGVPQSFVSKYESGERRLDTLELRRICDALGTTVPKFLRRLDRSIASFGR